MDEETQQDIDDASQHHQQQLDRAQAEGWEWWPSYHDSVVVRQRAEREQFKALSLSIDRMLTP